ncbi:MAG: hypothetical protein ACON35_07295 [Candidatus Marinamargulisbacteria bacterium]
MITTGVPVSIALTEWLAQYVSRHLDWFDTTSEAHQEIQKFINGESTEPSPEILRYIGVALTLFDGGVFSANVRSVYASEDDLSITWANGITHGFSVSGWDRKDRLAMAYIAKRCLNIQFDDVVDVIRPAIQLLHHHCNNLTDQLADGFLTTINADLPFNEMTFLVLSCLSNQQLDAFYADMADAIPEEFHFDGLDQAMSAHAFFKRPVTDDILVLDKVKMHYNLLFHVQEPFDFIEDVRQRTQSFLTRSLANHTDIDAVKNQLDQVKHQQLAPRLQLISTVLDAFQWPS